jgi:hypothetical protein
MSQANEEEEYLMAVAKKAAPTKAIVVEMGFDRSTKGTHVFTAKDDAAAISTLYVRKSGFESGAPEGVVVTVELVSE